MSSRARRQCPARPPRVADRRRPTIWDDEDEEDEGEDPYEQEETRSRRSTTTNGTGTRTKNFNRWELRTLCTAWSRTTEDPKYGNNQKGPVFYGKIHQEYQAIFDATDPRVHKCSVCRSRYQLQEKWKKIKGDMQTFQTHWVRFVRDPPSGVPKHEYIDRVAEIYKQYTGSRFKWKDCVTILHDSTKYSEISAQNVQESILLEPHRLDYTGQQGGSRGEAVVTPPNQNPRSNMVGATWASHQTRPMGCQKAKALAAQERAKRRAGDVQSEVSTLEATAGSLACDRVAEKLDQIAKSGTRLEKFLMRSSAADLLFRLGREDEANKVVNEMMPMLEETIDLDDVIDNRKLPAREANEEEEEEEGSLSPFDDGVDPNTPFAAADSDEEKVEEVFPTGVAHASQATAARIRANMARPSQGGSSGDCPQDKTCSGEETVLPPVAKRVKSVPRDAPQCNEQVLNSLCPGVEPGLPLGGLITLQNSLLAQSQLTVDSSFPTESITDTQFRQLIAENQHLPLMRALGPHLLRGCQGSSCQGSDK